MQILAADCGSNDWNSDEEDGFDPYWGVVDEGEYSETYIRQQATFLLHQLTPMMGRHAPKCGFLHELSRIAGTPLRDLIQPGEKPHMLCSPSINWTVAAAQLCTALHISAHVCPKVAQDSAEPSFRRHAAGIASGS